MGKLYAIVYMFGKIAMVMHWPDESMATCNHSRNEILESMDRKFITAKPNDIILHLDGKKLTRKDVEVKCELRTTTPELDDFQK
jgi:hypothetical protein